MTYNNETSIDDLEKIIAYRDQFTDVSRVVEDLTENTIHLSEEIVEQLKELGVPPENKIILKYRGVGQITFWYDAKKLMHFAEPKKAIKGGIL